MGMATAPELTERQLDLIQLALFLALFPISYFMWRHYQSMRRRFPGAIPPLRGGPEGAALAKAAGLPKDKAG